jgi:putative restriction endonuclease
MHGTISVTDFDWYRFLLERSSSEVNFWQPSDRRVFGAPEFSPYLFKLKAPHNAVCGFGYFARWSSLPDWLAWDCFGEGNGCRSLTEMRQRIGEIRRRIHYVETGNLRNIGCILLVQPTFFAPDEWVPQPSDWPARTVSGKKYDLTVGEGRRVWEACQERAPSLRVPVLPRLVTEPRARYGVPRSVVPRLGQGTFRVAVTEAYGRSCAATGEHSLPALDAAHIRSYSDEGPHEVRNGVLLRADLHRLFDQGYVTITADQRFEVSQRLREDYSNGRSYYPLHGAKLRVPMGIAEQPAPEYIHWHNENVYLG